MPINPISLATILFAIGLGVGAHFLRDQQRRLWTASWAALLAASLTTALGWSTAGENLLLATLFPAGQLMGAFALSRGRAPGWIAPVALAVGLLSAHLSVSDPASPLVHLRQVLGTAALLSAAVIVWRPANPRPHGPGLRQRAILPLLILAISIAHVLTGLLADGPRDVPGALQGAWLLILLVGFPLQLRTEDYSELAKEKRLQESMRVKLAGAQERFRLLAENSFDLVAELSGPDLEAPVISYANPRFRELLGYEPEDLVGRPAVELLYLDDLEAAGRIQGEALDDGHSSWANVQALHRDGHLVWLDAVVRGFTNSKGEQRWAVNARDATSRRLAEQLLQDEVGAQRQAREASEARFQTLADHSPELISEFNEHGVYTYANEAFHELLGIDPRDLIGESASQLLHDDDVAASRDGMKGAMQDQGRVSALHRLRHADGSWRWFDNTGRAYRTASGALRFVSIGRDVTETLRGEAERRKLLERIQESQRAESLRILAGGVAHDFNNILSVVLGNIELLKGELPQPAEVSRRFDRIRAAADHGRALTLQLLAYTARSVNRTRPLLLGRLVRDTEDLLRASVDAGSTLVLECEDEIPVVVGDVTELRQVLVNLVTNASEAIGQRGGTIRVRAMAAIPPAILGDPSEEEWAVMEVSDDGPGMEEATRKRISDPFFTTKAGGRGLGLAVVQGIVTAYGGFLVVESKPGEGSTFQAWLPPSDQPLEPAEEEWHPVPQASVGRLLVVDDDEPVRELHVEFLERAGFDVAAVGDGASALERIAASDEFDAVVLDLKMERVPGTEVLRRARTLRPDLPVVILTGFPGDLVEQEMAVEQSHSVLQKPCDPNVLVETVEKAIASVA